MLTTVAPVVFPSHGKSTAHGDIDAGQVDIDHPAPLGDADLEHPAAHDNAGRVHDAVDAARVGGAPTHRIGHCRFIGDVDRKAKPRVSLATSVNASALRSSKINAAPSAAKSCAVRRPIPDAAPVIKIRRCRRRPVSAIVSLPLWCSASAAQVECSSAFKVIVVPNDGAEESDRAICALIGYLLGEIEALVHAPWASRRSEEVWVTADQLHVTKSL